MAEGQFEPGPASREGAWGPPTSFARLGEGLEQTLQKNSRRGESNEVRFPLSLLAVALAAVDKFAARGRVGSGLSGRPVARLTRVGHS